MNLSRIVTFNRLLTKRIYFLVVVHLAVFVLSYEIALRLRFDMVIPAGVRSDFWETLPWILVIKLALFHFVGSLHGWWRYITFSDLAALLRTSTLASILIAAADYLFNEAYQVPRSVLLMDWGITILLVGGFRSIYRLSQEIMWPALVLQDRKPTLLIGALQGGEILARQIHNHPDLDFRIVGFIDEDLSKRGLRIGGIPFLGSPDNAVAVARKHEAKDLLIMSNVLAGPRLRELVDRCQAEGIRVKMVPPVDELINGSFRLQTRDVNINDLLRRDPVELDKGALGEMLSGKRVMVTGAGGSIGSEICRQILKCAPEKLLLVERAEGNLFEIHREFSQRIDADICVPCLADIGDEERMQSLFDMHQPHIVFHAAAHKHVPMIEYNPSEAIKNNVVATATLARLAHENNVERFVMISTDKAVNPTSIMGVSKQLAERYVHAHSRESNTKFVVVRFGNVLASAGSVVPIFQDQIRKGGPITVTHPEMRRFFMTIPEASQLVLQAAAMGNGGEIYVLEMGEQVKIVDLVNDLLRLSGCEPGEIEVQFTGMRPGEKLYEELYTDDEQTLETPHPKLRVAYHRVYEREELDEGLERLKNLQGHSDLEIRNELCNMALNFQYSASSPCQLQETAVHSETDHDQEFSSQ
ncbi:polysaccharide biosynthesis protein [Novipirellula sp. SH528]|uniref:polysaccharide biosynthesis protein n=1 Tax=Novipirellula sp. SH528 TaxID=3454466 RepID=UPI003F9ED3F9